MRGKLLPYSVLTPVLIWDDHAQRNDFKWAHLEVDGGPVFKKRRRRLLGRLFEKIDSLDAVQWHCEAQCGSSTIAVRLVQAQDESFSIFGPLQATERERQTVDREEVIHSILGSVPRGGYGDQRRVQRERFAHDVPRGPVSWMREKTVGEGMESFVRARVRVEGAA